MNNKSRKGRSSLIRNDSAGTGTSRPPQRGRSSDGLEGVYQNMRFLNTIASLIGNSVQVHLLDGKIIEGIFTTISPNFEVVLELAHEVDPNHPERINIKSIEENLVFGLKLIVTMTSKDIELDYLSKGTDTFLTDASFNRFNGLASKEKELEPWDDGSAEEMSLSLDSDANGWNANEMFKRNEQMYNVQSNFEEDLSQYTTRLEKKDTREYRELEEKALRLASSIESNVTSRMQVELENDADEEEKFAAVVRSDSRDFRESRDPKTYDRGPPTPTSGSGKYIPPQKRKGQAAISRVVRSTPPPHGHGPHPHTNTAPRHLNQQGGPSSYHGPGSEVEGPTRSAHMGSGPAHSYGSQGASQHQSFHGPQGRSHYAGRNQGYQTNRADTRLNGEERKVTKEGSPIRTNLSGPPATSSGPRSDGPSKEQRKLFPGNDLKKFGQDFRLQEPAIETKKASPATIPPTTASANPPTPTTPSPAPTPVAPPAPAPAAAPVPLPSGNVLNPQEIPGQQQVTSLQTELPALETKQSEELDKVTETLKKSNLNPNAKEFVFNPNAKVFTTRSPSTPTPPRSHTPQTAQGTQLLIPAPMAPVTSGFPGAGHGHHPVMVPTLVYPNYVTSNHGGPLPAPNHGGLPNQHFNTHAAGNHRFRKSVPAMTHRPELTSPMQVAAATGQPLLAPGPMPAPQFIYQSQGAIVQGTHQPYAPMYALRVMTPQGVNMIAPSSVSYQDGTGNVPAPLFMSPNMGHTQTSNAQSGMATHQLHSSSSSSPAQHQPLPQGAPTPTGTPQQVIYQQGNSHSGPITHNQGPPMPLVFIPPGHNQPPGPVMGNPQGVQLYPLGSSPAGMPLSQYQYIQQAHGGQPSPMQPMVPHNNP